MKRFLQGLLCALFGFAVCWLVKPKEEPRHINLTDDFYFSPLKKNGPEMGKFRPYLQKINGKIEKIADHSSSDEMWILCSADGRLEIHVFRVPVKE